MLEHVGGGVKYSHNRRNLSFGRLVDVL